MKKILRKASLFFKSSLVVGLLLLAYGVSATPTIEPFVFSLYNQGGKPVYYAISTTYEAYSNTLCATVNGLTTKEQVRGLLAPYASEIFTVELANNYIDNCSNPSFSTYFTFGLSEDGANYGMNVALLMLSYEKHSTSSSIPPTYTWIPRINWGNLNDPQISPQFVIDAGGVHQLTIYSDSSGFIY